MAEAVERRGQIVTLGLLSMAAGGMDALAFLKLGEIFTSAMSGNTIVFGLALGGGHMLAASHAVAAFAGYAVGVIIAAFPLRKGDRGRADVLAWEIMPLVAFALLWTAVGPERADTLYVLIVLSAVAMGLQGALARHLQLPGIMTTVITSTVTTMIGTVADRLVGGTPSPAMHQVKRLGAVYISYLASAVLVGWASGLIPEIVPYFPLLCITIVLGGHRMGWLEV